MKKNQPSHNFTFIGRKLLLWYAVHGRDLPFRKTKDPYLIWVCEIIFQQTRIQQGIGHYNRFIEHFPDVAELAAADEDEVLLYWKGLGYYSRALNLHKAAHQIMEDFGGIFPTKYEDILKLKGVGKYTAAAVASICFGEHFPAVDGNFYRVLARVFAEDFDVSRPAAFAYFSDLALRIMPQNEAGNFNQAMMDLGSEICRPKNPKCEECSLVADCIAFQTGTVEAFPVKSKKVKTSVLFLQYYFIVFENSFLVRRRGDDFIWKKLYEFPVTLPENLKNQASGSKIIHHKLTHKNLTIQIDLVKLSTVEELQNLAELNGYMPISFSASYKKSFPKPLEEYIVEAEKKAPYVR